MLTVAGIFFIVIGLLMLINVDLRDIQMTKTMGALACVIFGIAAFLLISAYVPQVWQ